jgi:flagellar M-ring protein FliF
MGVWQRFAQQWTQVWRRLSPMGRVTFSGAAAAFLVLIVWVGFWASTTNYAVLFSGLQPEDAAAIAQKLDADRIPYEVSGGGTTLLVPAERVLKVRMNLAMAGLPQGAGKGFELFDQMSMGATPFVQNLSYVRAIQGELARTIMQLEPVAHARVHIVQPDPTPFVRDEKPVTASVVIRTKAGQSLSRAATAGIVALVAGSVKGLTADNVTVLDSEGRVLSERRDLRAGLASHDQREYQREVEADLASKAQEILTRLLGPGQSVVSVTAQMSFRRVKEQSEKVDPDARVATRESTTSSKTTTPAGPRGTAGATANVPGAQPAAPNGSGLVKQDETNESDYAISRTHRQLEEHQGTIDRLTVAVILIPPTSDPDADPEEALGITAAEVKELVKQAVGFKEGRDQIQVSLGKPPVADAEQVDDTAFASAQRWQNYIDLVKASALVIAALAGLVLVVMMFRNKPPEPTPVRSSSNSATFQDSWDVGAVVSTLKAWLGDSSGQAQPT